MIGHICIKGKVWINIVNAFCSLLVQKKTPLLLQLHKCTLQFGCCEHCPFRWIYSSTDDFAFSQLAYYLLFRTFFLFLNLRFVLPYVLISRPAIVHSAGCAQQQNRNKCCDILCWLYLQAMSTDLGIILDVGHDQQDVNRWIPFLPPSSLTVIILFSIVS